MPQRRAAKKDLRQNKKRHQSNLQVKLRIKTAIKNFKKSLEKNDSALSHQALKEVYKTLDKAVRKKIIHPNKAARRKSRLSKLIAKTSSKAEK